MGSGFIKVIFSVQLEEMSGYPYPRLVRNSFVDYACFYHLHSHT